MPSAKTLLRMFATLVLMCATLAMTIHACLLVFRLTGQLSAGPMPDGATPMGYLGLTIALVFELALIIGCIAVRRANPARAKQA
ncbi:MAG: hypothetical protein JWN73_3363 [Betaproteobacteria bacterium]|nr:hypothetical protein [Betaproteobacteria bacterium]